MQSKIVLIPWDSESTTHRERLVEQRVQCLWDEEKVETIWRKEQFRGNKCIYWIVISPDDEDSEEKTKLHLNMYPKESERLKDTAASINGVPRDASDRRFIPVGHISLDAGTSDASDLGIDLPSEGVFWISTFFVTRALQGKGIGRAAMDEIETMATREPLRARTLMLNTVQKDDQLNVAENFFPKVTNQDWYTRRGYQLIKTVPDYYHTPDRAGKIRGVRAVFMRKDVV